jgi:Tfp pilus assembly protein PilV
MTKPLHIGMTVVEAMVAIAIFSVIASVAYTSYSTTSVLASRAADRSKATWLAEEGVEATRSIRDQNFATLAPGTYGISRTGGLWAFSGSSDTLDGFTRAITVSSVDSDTRSVQSVVSWTDRGTTYSSSLSTVLTNWRKTVGTAATYVTIDVSTACVYTLDSRYLGGVKLTYDGTLGPITIPQIKTSWVSTTRTLNQILAPYPTTVWTGSAASGATTTLATPISFSGAGNVTTSFRWDGSVSGKTFTIVFVMSDGSTKSVTIPAPILSICI